MRTDVLLVFRRITRRLSGAAGGVVGLALFGGGLAAAEARPEFLREVRPILSSKCFKCHGPDDKTREGGLRLDVREEALKPAKSGRVAIVPNDPKRSELLVRVHATDPDEVMPPASAKIFLTEAEKATLEAWIAAGAEYKPHWAFVPPVAAPLPAVKDPGWAKNGIDRFILAKLEQENLKPSPPADKLSLARRVYLDLIGMPPTPEEADAFAQDPAPDAYEKLVDRLLASPHYGERWARRWLDLARYADTNGYEKDRPRSIWPYRDWVIDALNADMPFDQFTVEQIAGDMLPNATTRQKVATGFHRNTMINEEGGIDPLEFRFYAMVDRVHTTATAWLGLTMACAQCHTHKYDPISHREYYQFFAYLNNTEEPTMPVYDEAQLARKREIEREMAAQEAALPEQFPAEGPVRWSPGEIESVQSASGASPERQGDGAWIVKGTTPEQDTYTAVVAVPAGEFVALKLHALADAALPSKGPGRTPHGNCVITKISAHWQDQPVEFAFVTADAHQESFPPEGVLDQDERSGWALQVPGQEWNVDHELTLTFSRPLKVSAPGKLKVVIEQNYGEKHTLGKFKISLGMPTQGGVDPMALRAEKFAAWRKEKQEKALEWSAPKPDGMKTNLPLLTWEGDGVIFASGDITKSDTYELTYQNPPVGLTAIRIEALPDERLPNNGPGRVYYEGPLGDFTLCNFSVEADGVAVGVKDAAASFAAKNFEASKALDDNLQTGWSIDGGQGKKHVIVFRLAAPLPTAKTLTLKMLFERHFAASLGKFRVSFTTDTRNAEPTLDDAAISDLLRKDKLTAAEERQLLVAFCQEAPELAPARAKIAALRQQIPNPPTTLVMTERPPENPRPTQMYHRGEFLQPTEHVTVGLPAALIRPGMELPKNRLDFARWLVSEDNPLVGRVIVNRQWQAFFGKGLVRTLEDFGFQGEMPSHPELLDWLALEFQRNGWSLKKLHKLIVMSATYQQASDATPEGLARDPTNKWLARGPRFRVEAEMVRDSVLKVAGQLSPKIGGPSVFPPQPPGVTSEGAYGALPWNVSQGEDKFRRALYTYTKRTTPYAMLATFDGPSGEACTAKRETSNTPLQSLTLLNDVVILEAAQALGKKTHERAGTLAEKLTWLFRQCLTRFPTESESERLTAFFAAQQQRFAARELDSKHFAPETDPNASEIAAWAVTARALLNLEEMFTK